MVYGDDVREEQHALVRGARRLQVHRRAVEHHVEHDEQRKLEDDARVAAQTRLVAKTATHPTMVTMRSMRSPR